MSDAEDGEQARLSTVIRLPARQKKLLRMLCTRRGIAMRDYVEGLVRAALAAEPAGSGRERMATAAKTTPAEFDEPRQCKFGCNYRSKSKSGLAQHEATCVLRRSRRAQARAAEVEARREEGVLA